MKPFKVTERYKELEHLSFEELQALNIKNKEGFVLHDSNGRIKVKFADYCRLHSIITNITARDIWRTISQGKPVDEILENVPDEFDSWVRGKVEFFNNEYERILSEAKFRHAAVLNDLPKPYTKKWFAMKNLSMNKEKFWKGLVFGIENGSDISEIIWKKLYPAHEKPFMNNDEDVE
ncbi:MAG TPA: hypothetical protein P5509_11705 [Bacteroidales bacterium]|nr:hypothetical protein [Bacteroidales bacterium]